MDRRAEVLMFPSRRGDADRRLTLALARLDRALAAQRAEIRGWREALGRLRQGVNCLEQRFALYGDRLAAAGQPVACVPRHSDG